MNKPGEHGAAPIDPFGRRRRGVGGGDGELAGDAVALGSFSNRKRKNAALAKAGRAGAAATARNTHPERVYVEVPWDTVIRRFRVLMSELYDDDSGGS